MKDRRKWSHVLGATGIAVLAASCAGDTNKSGTPLSSAVRCDSLTPKHTRTPAERHRPRGETKKGNAGCHGNRPVRYTAQRRRTSPPQLRRIRRGTSYGTGIVINRAGDVLTNHHVVNGCGSITVDLHGALFHGTKTADDPTNDLAVVRATGLTAKAFARLRTQKIRLAEDVLVLGYPLQPILGHGLKATTGNVSGLTGLADDPGTFQFTAPIQPGNSGGPVLDKSGLLVGLVSGKLDEVRAAKLTGSITQLINIGVKSRTVGRFLRAHRIRYSALGAAPRRSNVDVVAVASRYTGQVICKPPPLPPAPKYRERPANVGGYEEVNE